MSGRLPGSAAGTAQHCGPHTPPRVSLSSEWADRFIKERCPSSEPVLVWHSPLVACPAPPPQSSGQALLTNRLAGLSNPCEPPNATGRSTRGQQRQKRQLQQGQQMQKRLEGIPLEAQGCTPNSQKRHLQTLETKNFNTEMKKKAQVVRQAASQTPCAINQMKTEKGVFW